MKITKLYYIQDIRKAWEVCGVDKKYQPKQKEGCSYCQVLQETGRERIAAGKFCMYRSL